MSKKLSCKEHLREAVQILKDYCLFQSSTWYITKFNSIMNFINPPLYLGSMNCFAQLMKQK